MGTETIPETMRALLYNQTAQTLELTDSWPVPTPKFEKGEHLLKVHCTAITKGELTWPVPPEICKDYSPGVEMSGVVVACPPGSKFKVGSDIYMRTTFPRSASAREYTIGMEHELAPQPRNLSAEQAASVPVSALTAWQALFVQAGCVADFAEHQQCLPREQMRRILITGASGSVGVWATQLARLAGFWVVGTCHARNAAMVRDLGAHEVIDYTTTSVRRWTESRNSFSKFDLVLDCAADGSSTDLWNAAHPDHGGLLSIVAPKDMNFKWTLPRPEGVSARVNGRFFIMESKGEHLQKITELIEAGKLKPVVDSVFSFEDAKRAFKRADSGKTTGKVVVRIQYDCRRYADQSSQIL